MHPHIYQPIPKDSRLTTRYLPPRENFNRTVNTTTGISAVNLVNSGMH